MSDQTRRPKTADRVCSTCGRPLTQLGENGECLRCLVSAGFGVDENIPSAAPASRQRTTPGPLRYAHFEIEVGDDGFPIELGWGAMAVTYRARDTVLNSTVALKIIDGTIAANPTARARFLREARAAAQLHHPNVARVTHYGEQDGECFYVMELVEGETLEARVRREGPMPLALALEVIEQAARALAAAEAHGVVHRDIKPSNLMIEKEAGGSILVKVIDYGVAKMTTLQNEPGIDQTQSRFVGTPAFASPEQFAGAGQTAVDTRSDIYSLGVTLWYLLSGRTPFVGRTLEELAARQTKDLPVAQLRHADVPPSVLALLRSMLAIDPAERPQSARELLAAVHRCYVRFEPRARSRRKHLLVGWAIAALLLTTALLGTWFYQHARSVAQSERSIAVLPFDNLSPDRADAFFAIGMQDEIASELSHFAEMRTIGLQSTRSYAAGTYRDLPRIARELGVRHLLEGSVRRANGIMQVSMRLIDSRNPQSSWVESYQRPIEEIFALRNEITRAVAAQLRTSLSSRESAALNVPATTDLQAYELYLRARSVRSVVEPSVTQLFSEGHKAIEMLNQAVIRDPNFALAYCELAERHDELYFQRNVGPPEDQAIDHRSLGEVALEKARRLQPDLGAVHLQLALHALRINRDPEHAGYEVELARQTLPNNAQLETIAGRVARRADRWDEALHCFERGVSLEPRDVPLIILLADTYRCMRRYAEFDRLMARAIALTPADKLGTLPIHRALGQLESSADITALRTAYAQAEPQQLDDADKASAEMNIALWSHDADAITRCLATKRAIVTFNGLPYPDTWFEALAARIRGDNATALRAFTLARGEMERRALSSPSEGVPLSILAIIDAGLGRKEEAIQEAIRAGELSTFRANNFDATTVRCNLAVVYAWTGNNDLAIAELSKLVDRAAASHVVCQPTYGDFLLNPFWDPLRSDHRFTGLVAKLAPPVSP
jgi:serine/threonine protein kinase/Flp pilus assembly protein TadD